MIFKNVRYGVLFCILLLSSLPLHAAFSAADLASGSGYNASTGQTEGSIWSAVFGNYDFNTDQQTGQAQGDIIGIANNPGFFTAYNDGGTTGNTSDDFLAFRVRMNDRGPQNYNAIYLWVGVLADSGDSIDAYLNHTGDNQGHDINIYGPGVGPNTSPSTSTMVGPVNANGDYTFTNPDYTNYRAVDFDNSGGINGADGGTTNNAGATADPDPDWYVSFQIPFSSLITFLEDPAEMGAGNTISGVDDLTPLRFVIATSTNANSFNQDIGGIDGAPATDGSNNDLPWSQQPGNPLSQPFNSTGLVPEPSSSMLVMLGAAGLLLRRRRQD